MPSVYGSQILDGKGDRHDRAPTAHGLMGVGTLNKQTNVSTPVTLPLC